jgi:hypothetical protein
LAGRKPPVRLYFKGPNSAVQSDQNPFHIDKIPAMELLIHAKAIFRLSGFGSGREERRYNHPLAVNLVLAELDSSFGRRKSRYQ